MPHIWEKIGSNNNAQTQQVDVATIFFLNYLDSAAKIWLGAAFKIGTAKNSGRYKIIEVCSKEFCCGSSELNLLNSWPDETLFWGKCTKWWVENVGTSISCVTQSFVPPKRLVADFE